MSTYFYIYILFVTTNVRHQRKIQVGVAEFFTYLILHAEQVFCLL